MSDTTKFNCDTLFKRLDAFGIEFINHKHPPLRTVAESQSLRGTLPGAHIKNLFLRDKKRRYFLVTVTEDCEVNLKWLRRIKGAQGTLSFGSSEALLELLAVQPGSVTPLSIINDNNGAVTAFLDKSLLLNACVNVHPLRNDMTTTLSVVDLERFMIEENHPPTYIDFLQQI